MSMPHICTVDHKTSKSYLPYFGGNPNWAKRLMIYLKDAMMVWKKDPLCTEYFRSTTGYLNERKKHSESKFSYMIHPMSKVSFIHQVIIIWVNYVSFLYYPLDVAFNYSLKGDIGFHDFFLWIVADIIISLIYFVDMIYYCFEARVDVDNRLVILNQPKTIRSYVFSWYFLPDLLSAIPVNYFDELFPQSETILTVFSIARLSKIIRLKTFFTYMNRIWQIFEFQSVLSTATKFVIATTLFFHWGTCFYTFVPKIRFFTTGSYGNHSWILEVSNLTAGASYIYVFHKAGGLMMCARSKYTLDAPLEEYWITMILYLVGKIFALTSAVIVVNSLVSMLTLETKYQEIICEVNEYMKNKNLPTNMQERVLMLYEYKYQQKFIRERLITNVLSEKLRNEININHCQKLVQHLSEFGDMPPNALEEIVVHLRSEIYLPNDIIHKVGHKADSMWFLASGTVAIHTPLGGELMHLEDGAPFGHVALLLKHHKQMISTTAIETCQVYRLDKRRFKRCFKMNLKLYEKLRHDAEELYRKAIAMDEELKEELFVKTYMTANNGFKMNKMNELPNE